MRSRMRTGGRSIARRWTACRLGMRGDSIRRLIIGCAVVIAVALLLVCASDRGAGGATSPGKGSAADAPVPLPKAVDYSGYLTFIRKQTGGGCGTMASLAIFDILKEKEYPYAPDGSYRFAAYVYNDRQINQLEVMKQYGCCSESSLHTDADPESQAPPSPENYEEASIYRIGDYAPELIGRVTVDDLKKCLYLYGPIFACGDTPGSWEWAHCFAIVGYDDDKGEFTIVNSFGDRWGSGGMMKMPYSNVTNPPAFGTSPRVGSYRWVKDGPTSRIVPYTGRVRIHHTIARRYLTVKVGVEGQEPVVIWDRPDSVIHLDDSQNLVLDFPLPPYAGKFWPPGDRNLWYVEIRDGSPGPPAEEIGVVQGVTLAWRRAGKPPVLYRPTTAGISIPRGGTVKISELTRQ